MNLLVVPKVNDRLKTIISETGEIPSYQVPLDVQSWESAMSNELVYWSREYVCFSKLESMRLESRPLQRSQLLRLCYMHAPVYIQRFHGQQGLKMINMMEWTRSLLETDFSTDMMKYWRR